MFSCEIYKLFKNTYFEEHLRTATSNIQKISTASSKHVMYVQFTSCAQGLVLEQANAGNNNSSQLLYQ